MSASELQQLEGLLYQALPDPRGFANRVLEQLLDRLSTDPPAAQPVTLLQATVQDRNDLSIVLAAALGACECWGHDPNCDNCGGAGSSGWDVPDEELYTEYVMPAVRRTGMASLASTKADEPVGTSGWSNDSEHNPAR